MNKKIINKLIIIVILFIALFIVYKLIKTYAVFYSEGNATVEQKQANWTIKVNNTNISSGVETDFTVDQIEYLSNSHVLANNIAPGLSGKFYITIDPTNTDVAVRYDIFIDKSNLTNDSITIQSINEIQNNNTLKRTDTSTYTGVISLSDIQASKTNKIEIVLNWENNELNNANDTIVGTSTTNPSINIPVKVSVTQYLGETITEI